MNLNKKVGPETLQANIDINLTTPVVCENCKKQSFQEALMLREVSAILSNNGKSGVVPIQVMACVACGHVNNMFLPMELRRKSLKLS